MDEELIERLAQVAYEEHSGVKRKNNDDYFRIDAYEWRELPDRAKNHWRKLVKVVLSELNKK